MCVRGGWGGGGGVGARLVNGGLEGRGRCPTLPAWLGRWLCGAVPEQRLASSEALTQHRGSSVGLCLGGGIASATAGPAPGVSPVHAHFCGPPGRTAGLSSAMHTSIMRVMWGSALHDLSRPASSASPAAMPALRPCVLLRQPSS